MANNNTDSQRTTRKTSSRQLATHGQESRQDGHDSELYNSWLAKDANVGSGMNWDHYAESRLQDFQQR